MLVSQFIFLFKYCKKKFKRNDFFFLKVLVMDIIVIFLFLMFLLSKIFFRVFLLSLKLWVFVVIIMGIGCVFSNFEFKLCFCVWFIVLLFFLVIEIVVSRVKQINWIIQNCNENFFDELIIFLMNFYCMLFEIDFWVFL